MDSRSDRPRSAACSSQIRSMKPAKYLEMGTNVPGDTAFYPDDDLHIRWNEEGMEYTHKDGRKY